MFIFAGMGVMLPSMLHAQASGTAIDFEQIRVSYIYAAVMGSGTYKINERRISMLRFPFSFTQRQMTQEQAGLKWELPVVLGYDALKYEDWFDRILEDELMTLTVLPGLEYQKPLNEFWTLKPFVNLGAGYDFTREETIFMGVLGFRALGTWLYEDHSELRVGASGRLAAEYQVQSYNTYRFSLFEGGLDYRRDAHFRIFSRATNAGVYYRAQLFVPQWKIGRNAFGNKDDLGFIHEIGGSIGFQDPHKILGFAISRVRMGYKFGDGVRGWTIGTEFPF